MSDTEVTPETPNAAETGHAILEAPGEMGRAIAEELPEFVELMEEIVGLVQPVMSYVHSTTKGTALGAVTTQASNAFIDTVSDALRGRGRPALTNVRSLFELVVTTLDITGSKKLDERYRDHEWVALQQAANLTFELDFLRKKERSALLHEQKKVKRDHREKYVGVVKKHGKSFESRWSPDDLASRATAYGLEDEYSFYRVASAVLHGSAGGVLGLRRQVEGATVFRIGPALSLCPMALLQALRYYGIFIRALSKRGGPGVVDLLRKIDEAKRVWPDYRAAVMRLDRSIWPQTPPPFPMTIFAFKEGGAFRRWYVWDPVTGLVCDAVPPKSLPKEQEDVLEALIKESVRLADPSDLITVAMIGVDPRPKAEARWQYQSTLLPSIAPEGLSPAEPIGKN